VFGYASFSRKLKPATSLETTQDLRAPTLVLYPCGGGLLPPQGAARPPPPTSLRRWRLRPPSPSKLPGHVPGVRDGHRRRRGASSSPGSERPGTKRDFRAASLNRRSALPRQSLKLLRSRPCPPTGAAKTPRSGVKRATAPRGGRVFYRWGAAGADGDGARAIADNNGMPLHTIINRHWIACERLEKRFRRRCSCPPRRTRRRWRRRTSWRWGR